MKGDVFDDAVPKPWVIKQEFPMPGVVSPSELLVRDGPEAPQIV